MLHKQYPKYSRSIVSIAVLIILTIGFSRLYLGVHFPSDVIAGYLLGGVWLLLGIEVIGWKLSTSSTPSIFCYTRK
jgi:undecaprenyl-diphosphatase